MCIRDSNNNGLSLRIIGGVFGGYALRGTTFVRGGVAGDQENEVVFDEEEGFDRGNVGYVLGLGVKLNDLIISLRASIGVSDIATFPSNAGVGSTTYKSREFSLVGAYLF